MRDFLNFSKKIVLVTGSTRNIGKAIAGLFAEHGATVIINGRHQEDIERTTQEFTLRGNAVYGMNADVSNPEDVSRMFQEIEERFGRLDVLVNNAAARPFKDVRRAADSGSLEEALRTNAIGAFNASQHAVALMVKKGSGSIINILSTAAVSGSPIADLDYVVSKGALYALTRGMASQLQGPAQEGKAIRINAILTSPIWTGICRVKDAKYHEHAAQSSLLKRVGLPEEVAAVCLFLASDLASYVTGETIALGGYLKVNVDL